MLATGWNKRVQLGSAIRHGETDCLENAGRLPATVYARSTMVTTLSPCDMCTGAILLYKIPRVIVGENRTFYGAEDLLRARGVEVVVLDDAECVGDDDRVHRGRAVAVERGHRCAETGPSTPDGPGPIARRKLLVSNLATPSSSDTGPRVGPAEVERNIATMDIAVLIKQVPDTWSERTLTEPDWTLDRDAADAVIDEIDTRGVETALQLIEKHGGEVTVVTMGPDRATDALRKALAMGVDKAVHISRRRAGRLGRAADLGGAGRGPPHAVRRPDHHRATSRPTAAPASVPSMLAERLGLPQVTSVRTLEIDGTDAARRAGARRRLQRGHRHPAGRRLGHREDQRAALPQLQGHHGREEEAGDDARRSTISGSMPATTGLANASTDGRRRRAAAAAANPARRSPMTAPAAPRSPSTWSPPG